MQVFRWLLLLFIPLLPLLMIYVDEPLTTSFNDRSPGWYFAFNKSVTDTALGQWYFAMGILGPCFIWLFLKLRNESPRRPILIRIKAWLQFLVAALTVSGLSILALKMIVGRARPFVVPEHDPLLFRFWTLDWNYQSFPSGHAQVIFAVAFSVAAAFPKIRALAVAVAAIISFSRVVVHNHFLTDILMGALCGYFISQWLYLRIRHHRFFDFSRARS